MKKFVDLIGLKFNHLTVVDRVEEESENGKKKHLWKCVCDCKDQTIVYTTTDRLKNGTRKSCGCANRIDLTGQKFGNWTVLEYVGQEKHKTLWKCQCDCGTIRNVSSQGLRNGTSKSCGCLKSPDLTGMKFGHLTVLEKVDNYVSPKGLSRTRWKCICDCPEHKIVYATAYSLKSGNTKSCGCSVRNQEDLTGKTFGRWTVLEYAGTNGKNVLWKCQCSCNKHTIKNVTGTSLRNETSTSCGCKATEKMLKHKKDNPSINKYDLSGEYGIGWTSNTNNEFYFDLEDYNKIKNYYWYENDNGYIIAPRPYEERNGFTSNNIRMHKLILGIDNDSDNFIDHIKGNRRDNRKSELRICTKHQNAMNHKISVTNTSGVTGVYYDNNRNKWIASITYNYKSISLGRFDKFEDAVKARKIAEEKYFGEYSYDNSQKHEEQVS